MGCLFSVQFLTPAILTHPCLTGGSLGNDLDKHVGLGDGLEVDAGENLEVLETTSVIEESKNLGDGGTSDTENITEPPVIETATDLEPNFDNLTGDEKENIEEITISNQIGDGLADPDEVVEEEMVEGNEKNIAGTDENEIPTASE